MKHAIIAVLMGLCLAASTFAQENTTDRQAQVRQLIRQLEDRNREVRDKAETDLRAMGSAVLSMLPEINARTSGELKQRILRIRDHLEKQELSESTGSSNVTLQGEMTIDEVFSAIEEQTGNVILDYRSRLNQPSDDSSISLDLDDVPFWEALDQILDKANLTTYTFVGEPRKLAVVAAGDGAAERVGSGAYAGLFRVEPTQLTLDRNLRNPGADTLRMSMEVIWEPRVLPILIRQDLGDIELTTDNGETLSVATTGTAQIPVQPNVAAIDMRLPLSLPSRDAKEIASLKGTLVALVPGGDVSFEFTDLTQKNVQQRKGGLTVVLDQVRKNGGVQQIYIRLRLDQANDSLQSHLDWVENNGIQLIDPDGKEADQPGYEKYLERDSEVGYSYIYPVEGDLKGWKLIYTTPAGIAEVPVEYELKGISLP